MFLPVRYCQICVESSPSEWQIKLYIYILYIYMKLPDQIHIAFSFRHLCSLTGWQMPQVASSC